MVAQLSELLQLGCKITKENTYIYEYVLTKFSQITSYLTLDTCLCCCLNRKSL